MRILIIDDDPMISEFVRLGLKEDGYAVDIADTGEEGRTLAFVNDYDGILLDVMLPDTSGVEIARELRSKGRTTPILMLTGKTDTKDKVTGLDAGADDYLTKPFEIVELKARVRALVRRGGATRSERVEFGGLTLDRLSHEIANHEKKLRLTPKEHALLEFLLLHAEHVVTRTQLLEKVWDMQFDPDSNVVDVHVARLRRKMERAEVEPSIFTVRGVGFTLTLHPQDRE